MPKITVVAKLVAKKDSMEAVKTELLKLIEPTRREQGCIEYRLHQDNDDPAVFVFYENWESAACLEKHAETEHYKAFTKALRGLVGEKNAIRMNLIA